MDRWTYLEELGGKKYFNKMHKKVVKLSEN